MPPQISPVVRTEANQKVLQELTSKKELTFKMMKVEGYLIIFNI